MFCTTTRMTLGELFVEQAAIETDPEYQREGGVWSVEKQQLFIDSIFNGYDVPKLYFHDLRGSDPLMKYAVVDGKQRLYTVWTFLGGNLALADDFRLSDTVPGQTPPAPGAGYRDLSPYWQERFKAKALDVVLVQGASPEDVEDLFSRLNNGEPLNAAEKRNALGGDMAALIREVAALSFFTERVRFDNGRYRHFEAAAKLLRYENAELDTGNAICDVFKRRLDDLVREHRHLDSRLRETLLGRVEKRLRSLSRVFGASDPLLRSQASLPFYYLLVKEIEREYASPTLYADLRAFVGAFHTERRMNLERDEDERDPVLLEFTHLSQQGTNTAANVQRRVEIAKRRFLEAYPTTQRRDPRRRFSEDERMVVYHLSGGRCSNCEVALPSLDEMEADHRTQWAFGGKTALVNSVALCRSCNRYMAQTVA